MFFVIFISIHAIPNFLVGIICELLLYLLTNQIAHQGFWILSFGLDSGDGFRTGCRNVSHKQHSFSRLQSPTWSFSIKVCYSWVQTIFFLCKTTSSFSCQTYNNIQHSLKAICTTVTPFMIVPNSSMSKCLAQKKKYSLSLSLSFGTKKKEKHMHTLACMIQTLQIQKNLERW